MSLQNWLNNGWLTEHRTSLQEIKADAGLIALFNQFRKKRNISGYDHAGMVSNQEAKEMVTQT